LKDNATDKPLAATITIPLDMSYIGKTVQVNSSDDDTTWSPEGSFVAQSDGNK